MKEQKPFLLRLPKPLLEAYQKWAEDELRSLNGQMEFILRQALRKEGRWSQELEKKLSTDTSKNKK